MFVHMFCFSMICFVVVFFGWGIVWFNIILLDNNSSMISLLKKHEIMDVWSAKWKVVP